MDLKSYYMFCFLSDLKKLKFSRYKIAQEINKDNPLMFFGGRQWENCANDLKHVSEDNKPYFVLCIFMIITADLNMHHNLRMYYERYRAATMHPKLGWSGFGNHIEHQPTYILYKPIELGIIKEKSLEENLCDFIQLYHDEAKGFFNKNIPELSTKEFFCKLCEDVDFQISKKDKGRIFEKIYIGLKELAV